MNDFTDIVSKMMEVSPAEGDYTGEDGLLYCGKCHTPKERVPLTTVNPASDLIIPGMSLYLRLIVDSFTPELFTNSSKEI